MLFGVIQLPVLWPIAALLQLLFPGLLREQWRQYKYLVRVLLTQSTLIFLHMALVQWVFKTRPWWLADAYLTIALVVVAAIGAFLAWRDRRTDDAPSSAVPTVARPVSLEFWAIGVLAAAGLIYLALQWHGGTLGWDQMTIITIVAVAGLLHLLYRRATWRAGTPVAPHQLTTERLLLSILVLVGGAVAWYTGRADANQIAAAVTADWPTFRGNMERTGAASRDDAGPKHPSVLWTFEPDIKNGSLLMYSSPTVVDGQLYIGALHQVLSSTFGYVYCVNVADSDPSKDGQRKPGERLWTFGTDGTIKAVFSSPSVCGNRLYIGEGFHEDSKCRLFCLDPSNADKTYWTKSTTSHVESSPTIVQDRIYFGAGDDGVYCLQLPDANSDSAKTDATDRALREVWHMTEIHVDSSPTVVDNRVYVGSIEGDVYKEFVALAIDAATGKQIWRTPSEYPLPASPTVSGKGVYFAVGNGKLNVDAKSPFGAVRRLDGDTGEQQWEFRTGSAVFSSPIVSHDRVYVVSGDCWCYCLNAADGKVEWKTFLSKPLVACPVLAGGRLFVQAVTGALFCLRTTDGEIDWTFNEIRAEDNDACASPALVNGRLYVAVGGKVYCVGDR